MTSNAGWATLTVIPSFQGFQSKLTNGVSQPMAEAGKKSGAKFGDTAGREASSSFKGRFSSALKGFNPLAGLAIGAGAVALFKGAIDEASSLSESGNKINTIFGDAAKEVNAFADAASEGLGQSDLQARNAAASFGVYGKAAGLAGSELAGFSTDLTALASDLASFYDTSVEDAIQAIGSGLRGEAEPLRAFGVLLDDATLRTEALRQGLIETTKDALTPQQKVLAAQAVIMQQTAVAQGDFAKTSDGLANSTRDLQADIADMSAELGKELLPAASAFVNFAKDDMLPTLGAAGGLAKDAVEGFAALPGPVKASAAAFIALRIAAATGLTAAMASGVASVGSAMTDLRIRTMLAADAFNQARRTTIDFSRGYADVSRGVGRLSASLEGLRAGARGAGSALRSGLGSAMGLLGGPWGAAMIGATALVAHFWSENEKAKQYVDDLTASLDAQNGSLTANTDEIVKNRLAEKGWLDYADKLGVSMDDVRLAAEGNAAALARVRAEVERQAGSGLNPFNADAYTNDSEQFIGALEDSAAAIGEAKSQQDVFNRFLGDGAEAADNAATATAGAADVTEDYATKLKDARDRVRDLIQAEQERYDNAVQNRRDQLGLISTLREAQKEAREGKRTLDENTKAGQANWEALLDVADQWNNSTDKVRNARGAYKDMRKNFIDLATEMGASDEKAKRLFERLVKPPKPKIKVDSTEIQRAIERAKELQAILDGAAQGRRIRLGVAPPGAAGARANGGPVNAHEPYWVGERGPELIVPNRAGNVLTAKESAAVAGGGVTINIDKVIANSGGSFMDDMRSRAGAAVGGMRRR